MTPGVDQSSTLYSKFPSAQSAKSVASPPALTSSPPHFPFVPFAIFVVYSPAVTDVSSWHLGVNPAGLVIPEFLSSDSIMFFSLFRAKLAKLAKGISEVGGQKSDIRWDSIFHAMENYFAILPHHGRYSSTLWKTLPPRCPQPLVLSHYSPISRPFPILSKNRAVHPFQIFRWVFHP